MWIAALINPFGSPARVVDAVTFVDSLSGYADVYPDIDWPSRVVRDPDDDYLVALAEAASARIVTGDADVLNAGLEPPAITPHDLLLRLRAR